MKRAHRTVHRLLWPVMAVALGLALSMAFIMRPPPPSAAVTEVHR